MNYQWNWGLLLREPYAGWLLTGLGWTVALSITGWLIALPLGTAIGIDAIVVSNGSVDQPKDDQAKDQ